MIYRAYEKEDISGILALFKACGYNLSVEYYNWINFDNPFGESIIHVAKDQDNIIGHYAVMPVDLDYNGETIRAGFAIQATIHPDHRNLENIIELTEAIWGRCKDKGIKFVYGFPNDRIWPICTNLMGFKPIGDFRAWELPIEDFRLDVNGINGNYKATDKIRVKKTDYRAWRFLNHPLNHYVLRMEDWVSCILKLYDRDGKKYGHIIDFETLSFNFLEGVRKYFQKQLVDIISCWVMPGPYANILQTCGFKQTGFMTHFGYRPISDVPEGIDKLENWHITMADSDAF